MAAAGLDQQVVKQELLKLVERYANERGYLQTGAMLSETAKALKIGHANTAADQVLLTVWHDLFRSGILSWGCDLSNPGPPFFHVTDRGRAALKQLSRDPSNPAGYLAHLKAGGSLNPIAMSYIAEGLETYNAGCYRATAVMVGCASESVMLELRDLLIVQLTAKSLPVSKKLEDWRIKTVLDQLAAEIDQRLKVMPRPLQEEYSAYWPAFTGQIRMARNDAGHPTSIDPVTVDTVHASLLIFPQLAKLSLQLLAWVKTTV